MTAAPTVASLAMALVAGGTYSGVADAQADATGMAGLVRPIAESTGPIGTVPNTTPITSATVQGDGSWSVAVALGGDGTHPLVARLANPAGYSADSAPVDLLVDTAAHDGIATPIQR
jgi:hypothetical protein